MRPFFVLGLSALLACGAHDSTAGQDVADGGDGIGFEPPVLLNPESPVQYPPALYREQVEGTVVLRLFVDRNGGVVPESTRVAEGSGMRALDSAALDAVQRMRFAPARRDGNPVSTAFLQPVDFRHPARSAQQGAVP